MTDDAQPTRIAALAPRVGGQVHYVSYGTPGGEYASVCRAATIAEVGAWMTAGNRPEAIDNAGGRRRMVEECYEPDACALVVTNPTGLFFNTCRYDPGGTSATPGAPAVKSYLAGTWHWADLAYCS